MKIKYIYLCLILTVGVLYQCTTRKQITTNPPVAAYEPPKADINSSPVVPAGESISKMKLENGFGIKLIASEPLISTPIAMNFDNKGRIWVLEMTSFMPDSLGNGEDRHDGKVVLLSDNNGDGVMDDRKVIIDTLVMPRALCLIAGGILVAEPPFLWYYKLAGDKVVKKELVDNKYTDGGNAEHSSNGLYRALDNWIYNANSEKRYRKVGDKWLIEATHGRGQWGVSQDNAGRIYANSNSTNLTGDYFPPSLGNDNKNQKSVSGFNIRIVNDNRVFPIRPTPGVNRGYMKGVLDDSLRLVNFTAACGPFVYRGGLFGPAYAYNAFVAEPSANLIKRNIISEKGNILKGVEAYHGKEFLASVDERFRPVSLYDGPDGAMYIVDMYRGIIQHKAYLTPYLKGEIGKRNLTQPLACGRIYKVYPTNKQPVNVVFPEDPLKLVQLLGNANGFVRDRAQQILIDANAIAAIPALREAIKSNNNPLFIIHALWTLEGLNAIKTDEVLALLQQPLWQIRMQALTVLPSVVDKNNYKQFTAALQQIVANNDTVAAPYVGFVTNAIKKYDVPAADELLLSLVKKYPHNVYVADAVVSNLQNREAVFKKQVAQVIPDTSRNIHRRIQVVLNALEQAKNNSDPKVLAKLYPKGAVMFNTICKTCHGEDGNGIAALGPPLNGSEIVNGNKEIVMSIILKGLTGPVKVRGHLYKAPEISTEMPGFADNKEFTDTDIIEVINYVRSAWNNRAKKINAEDLGHMRDKLKKREKAFTMDELDVTLSTN
jgi:mono/diheme cytochrome c family protein